MTKVILFISLCLFAGVASATQNDDLTPLWEAWKYRHMKTYSEVEEPIRFAIFSDNHHKILKFNQENDSPQLAINKFADLTSTEFKQQYVGKAFTDDLTKDYTIEEEDVGVLPSAVDWRNKGAVTPVKNQGQCGSCWAICAVDSLESLFFIDNAKLITFSSQQIIDCDTQDFGCSGGEPNLALEYAIQYGLETDKEYPLTGAQGQCAYNASLAYHIALNYSLVPPKSVNALKTALVKRPVAAAVEADQDIWQFYKSGVVKANCGAQVDHGVNIVGYEKVGLVESFIVKNMWGADWGDNGYIYIAAIGTINQGLGLCGILSSPLYPTN